MKILVSTDAWHPQVNGVVRTLGHVAREASALGVELEFLTPNQFWTLPMPSYPEIRLALATVSDVARRIERSQPDAIHIATEGPLGHTIRRVCLRRGLSFTTSFHTRFPDYLAERLPAAERWTREVTWAWLRRFHAPGAAVLASTPTLSSELTTRGFKNVKLWPRGVDADLFYPRAHTDLNLPRPIFLTVSRLAVEKNLEAFLKLDLPGSKLVVGDGPARNGLARNFPDAVFIGSMHGQTLAEIYAAADVFVFPSRTDTFGLVLLEALASGVPVAAFPAAAPRDVIGEAPVGVLNEDLRRACLDALNCSRDECRAFALGMTWAASVRIFLDHVTQATRSGRKGAALNASLSVNASAEAEH
ncbi:MAG TPA: glycosyltransferase family 1 protein [Pseudolabrys sp.]|jgi:glycosyltransferase involved in cell wall biosynthesis|nr:glycosyltransferase family 1 protein [Pseudolabrys sp.]